MARRRNAENTHVAEILFHDDTWTRVRERALHLRIPASEFVRRAVSQLMAATEPKKGTGQRDSAPTA